MVVSTCLFSNHTIIFTINHFKNIPLFYCFSSYLGFRIHQIHAIKPRATVAEGVNIKLYFCDSICFKNQ